MVEEQQTLIEELRVLAWLLGIPCQESRDEIELLAGQHLWLTAGAEQLKDLPLEQWQAEHTRLFISGFPKTIAIPFESVYLTGEMGGPAQESLIHFFNTIGLQAEEGMADYLGTLLEALAFLLEQNNDQMASELKDKHLHKWVRRFADDVKQHSEVILYQSLADRLLLNF